jgi:hypothetical protein
MLADARNPSARKNGPPVVARMSVLPARLPSRGRVLPPGRSAKHCGAISLLNVLGPVFHTDLGNPKLAEARSLPSSF